MSLSEHAKLAISLTGGTVAMGVAYLVFLRQSSPKLELDPIEEESWPTLGATEKKEKEALIDAILEEPCMLEAMVDPTRKPKFNPGDAPLI